MNLVKIKILDCTDSQGKYKHLVGDHGFAYEEKDDDEYYRIPHVNIKVKKEDCEPCNDIGRNF